MHRFSIHPSDPPNAWMPWLLFRGDIPNAPVRTVISNVGRTTARIPIQKEAWPVMVMHRNRLTRGRHADLKNANKFILKNDFMSCGRRLDGIVAVGELRFVLSVQVKMPREEYNR
jgi:hypothetical protein